MKRFEYEELIIAVDEFDNVADVKTRHIRSDDPVPWIKNYEHSLPPRRIKLLNVFGEDGWEIVNVEHTDDDYVYLIKHVY